MQHPSLSHLTISWSAINVPNNLLRKSVASFTNSLHSILVTIPGSYFVRLAYKRPEPVADTFLRRGLMLAKTVWGETRPGEKLLEREGFRSRQGFAPRGYGVLTHHKPPNVARAEILGQRMGAGIARFRGWRVRS